MTLQRSNLFPGISKATLRPWIAQLFRSTKKNALKRNIEFNIDEKYLVYLADRSKGCCMLTGIPFEFELSSGDGKRRPWFPSLDRIDSSRGYSKGNCRLVCVSVNLAMNVWGEEVLVRIARHLFARHRASVEASMRNIAKKRLEFETEYIGKFLVGEDEHSEWRCQTYLLGEGNELQEARKNGVHPPFREIISSPGKVKSRIYKVKDVLKWAMENKIKINPRIPYPENLVIQHDDKGRPMSIAEHLEHLQRQNHMLKCRVSYLEDTVNNFKASCRS